MSVDEAWAELRAERARLERDLEAAQDLLRDAREAVVEGGGFESYAGAREEVLQYQDEVERLEGELQENERAEQLLERMPGQ